MNLFERKGRFCQRILFPGFFVVAFLLIQSFRNAGVSAAGGKDEFTLLFTHDLHSHLLPTPVEGDALNREEGGFPGLFSLIKEEKKKGGTALLLADAGDFSMGTFFHVLFPFEGMELWLLGQMGYDATTLGNHEFDFTGRGLCQALASAQKSGDPLPAILQGNLLPLPGEAESTGVKACLESLGVSPYRIIRKGGLKIGVFGLMGDFASQVIPSPDVLFSNPVRAARQIVRKLREVDSVDLVICLSHTGTGYPKGDDWLARKVRGIDIVVSGHSHSLFKKPLSVGESLIVSAGKYGRYLGVLKIFREEGDSRWKLHEYRLEPVTEETPQDSMLLGLVETYKEQISRDYFSGYGLQTDSILAESPGTFLPLPEMEARHEDNGLGRLIADAFRDAVRKAEGEASVPADFALLPVGTLRASFPLGPVTVGDVFQALSLGIGPEGTAGYPLVSAWLTGKEILNLVEVDASITPFLPDVQLYFSGLYFSWIPGRLPFNKVTEVKQRVDSGSFLPIEKEKLYRVVCSVYAVRMLSLVRKASYGLLSLVPKYADGTPVPEPYQDIVLKTREGKELKEWFALADFLASFPVKGGYPQIPAEYYRIDPMKEKEPLTGAADWLQGLRAFTVWVLSGLVLLSILAGYGFFRLALSLGRRVHKKTSRK